MAGQTEQRLIRSQMNAPSGSRQTPEDFLVDQMNRLTMRLRTRCQSKAGLAIGSGSAAKILITNTIDFLIDGVVVRKTTAEIVVPAGAAMANTAGAKEVWVMLSSLDGVTVTATAGAVAASGAGERPTLADDAALVGYVKIAAATLTTFTPATTNLNATGMTATYVDQVLVDAEFVEGRFLQ